MPKGQGSTRGSRSFSQGVADTPTHRFDVLDGLAAFMKEEGNTLLIKGYAGAGKTTLALQLLDQLSPRGHGVYVSSRVSQSKVRRELPWTKFDNNGNSAKGFEDMRLGSPEYFMEEIMRVLSKKGRSAPPVVVLDTWDGIAKELPPEDRLKAEKMLITAADVARARTIFVSEEPERTTMDYLVDGIVEMKREEWHGRIFREIEVQKLRGTLIEQHKYLYTLEGGRFTLVPPFHYFLSARAPQARKPDLIPEGDESMSFGSPDMDRVFGRLRTPGVYSLLYDENIPYSAIRLITIPAIINALNSGRAVFDIPLPGTTNRDVAEAIRPFVPPDIFRNCLAIGSVGGDPKVEAPLYSVRGAEPMEAASRVNELITLVRDRSEKKSVLLMESLGMFEAIFATRLESMVEAIGERAGAVHSTGTDTVMFLMQSDSPICSRTLGISERYARMVVRDKSVVILGEKPATPAYVLDHHRENPLLPELTLIV